MLPQIVDPYIRARRALMTLILIVACLLIGASIVLLAEWLFDVV